MNLSSYVKRALVGLLAGSFGGIAIASSNVDTNPALNSVDKWVLEVAPYVWALNMNGDVHVGAESIHISQSFSDILQEFEGGGMLWLDLRKGRFGIYLNSLFAVLTKTETVDQIKIDMNNDFGLFAGGLSYTVVQVPMLQQGLFEIEPYVGARYTLNDTKLTVLGLSFSQNEHWTDPLVGVRLRFTFNPQWLFTLAGDVGGTDFNTDKSYDLMGIFGYTPKTHFTNTTVYLGYRYLYQLFSHGSGNDFYEWDMRLFGPILGVGIRF